MNWREGTKEVDAATKINYSCYVLIVRCKTQVHAFKNIKRPVPNAVQKVTNLFGMGLGNNPGEHNSHNREKDLSVAT